MTLPKVFIPEVRISDHFQMYAYPCPDSTAEVNEAIGLERDRVWEEPCPLWTSTSDLGDEYLEVELDRSAVPELVIQEMRSRQVWEMRYYLKRRPPISTFSTRPRSIFKNRTNLSD